MESSAGDLNLKDKARTYIQAALDLIERADAELRKGDLRQASEKIWGAAALALKAHACWRGKGRLASHRELWEYEADLAKELGEWVNDSWYAANAMHANFCEGWADRDGVEGALRRVKKLVKAIAGLIGA